MQKIYFNNQKSVFVKKNKLPFVPSASPLHSKMEMMDSFRIYGHMTPNVYCCLETGGGSTYPLVHLTPLSPTVKTLLGLLVFKIITEIASKFHK